MLAEAGWCDSDVCAWNGAVYMRGRPIHSFSQNLCVRRGSLLRCSLWLQLVVTKIPGDNTTTNGNSGILLTHFNWGESGILWFHEMRSDTICLFAGQKEPDSVWGCWPHLLKGEIRQECGEHSSPTGGQHCYYYYFAWLGGASSKICSITTCG